MVKSTTSVVAGTADGYTPYTTMQTEEKTEEKSVKTEEAAAVYEKSEEEGTNGTYSVNKMSAKERSALVKQLKSEQEERTKQLLDIVRQMIGKQAETVKVAGFDFEKDEDSVWSFLASGDYTVTEAAKEQAQEAISEDGYYGVKQTSERMFDFACALAGDDEAAMKKMQDAMQKGYEEATKVWGKELPDICKQTLEATNKLFEDYYASKTIGVEA